MEDILLQVQCPARYAGGEWNSVRKDPGSVQVKYAMCFPDVYEVGMSHLGSKILYHEVNRRDDALAERAFAPWADMEQKLRESGINLTTLENQLPLSEFDVLGFTLQYELTFTNIVNMLDLGGVPIFSKDRSAEHPVVIAGGPCAFNPEPLAEFIDAFAIGEGEEVIHDIINLARQWRSAGRPSREEMLVALAGIPGVYVPSLYEVEYRPDGTVERVRPTHPAAPAQVKKRVVKDLDACDYPTSPVVPFMDVVHDRVVVEVFRGCTRGCRFCQAGAIYRPVRERSLDKVTSLARETLKNTGYDEVSLTSLATNDYTKVTHAVDELLAEHSPKKVGVSLPSLRVDAFSVGLAERVNEVRRSGLTFAPEAGTQRLRDVINKNVAEEDIRNAASAAFQRGWDTIKLYFMIGLPTETEEDVLGIAEVARDLTKLSRRVRGGPSARLTVSVASFVPKSHTPFQWVAQDTMEVLEKKQALLKTALRNDRIRLDWHDTRVSFVEAVFARGDRRLAASILAAFRKGCRFDGWTDKFDFRSWMDAFAETGVDPAFYANRQRQPDETLPWDHVSAGLRKKWLLKEYERAVAGITTEDCRRATCGACGVCSEIGAERIVRGG